MSRPDEVTSHWHDSVEGLSTSAKDYFAAIEAALREKQAPVTPERIEYHESGVLSDRREYLRVSYGRLSMDIGAAPFGRDYFFSWWMVRRLSSSSLMLGCGALMALPILLVMFVKALGVILGTLVCLVVIVGFIGFVASGANHNDAIEDALLALPVIGSLYQRFVRPRTYYAEDTERMFEETVHRVVIAVVSGILTLNQLDPLDPAKQRPSSRRARLL